MSTDVGSDQSVPQSEVNLKFHLAGIERCGAKTREAVDRLNDILKAPSSVANGYDRYYLFRILYESFNSPLWNDKASAVVEKISELVRKSIPLQVDNFGNWIKQHPNDDEAVLDCVEVNPPKEVSITKRLSTAGKQKLVFLAAWKIGNNSGDSIVIKKFRKPEEEKDCLLRELISHPFSLSHSNIIETHLLTNGNRNFLVERLLDLPLTDAWRCHGYDESANILYNIAHALTFIHHKGYIHGDIKPDNIGFDHGKYVLLDFGVCRKEDSNDHRDGSLRTRSPEVITKAGQYSSASDIWALGATIYKFLTGRFPLYEHPDEVTPDKPEAREAFEAALALRVTTKWDQLVDLSKISEPMRSLLQRMLSLKPKERPQANRLLQECEAELSAHVREQSDVNGFSAQQERRQLIRYLAADKSVLTLMARSQRRELKHRITYLLNSGEGQQTPNAASDRESLTKILTALGDPESINE